MEETRSAARAPYRSLLAMPIELLRPVRAAFAPRPASPARYDAVTLEAAAQVCDGRANAHRLASDFLEASKCASAIRGLADQKR